MKLILMASGNELNPTNLCTILLVWINFVFPFSFLLEIYTVEGRYSYIFKIHLAWVLTKNQLVSKKTSPSECLLTVSSKFSVLSFDYSLGRKDHLYIPGTITQVLAAQILHYFSTCHRG